MRWRILTAADDAAFPFARTESAWDDAGMNPWHHLTTVRFLFGGVLGIVAGVITAPVLGIAVALLVGWSAFAAVLVIWVLVVTWPMDHTRTRTHASAEDPGHRVGRLIAIIGSMMSLAAVGIVLVQSHQSGQARTLLLACIVLASVVASWFLIQVGYMLRYARMYYSSPEGGIDFNDDEPPQYSDFAYFSVGLGMTYQVADTDVHTKELRKVIVAQTMLAYLFATVIIGTVVNLVTSLV